MNRVALVNMPWSSLSYGSIALGILKRMLRRAKIPADIFNLNLDLARRMDLNIYTSFAMNPLPGEWMFSQHLFGQFGSRELKNSLSDLLQDPVFQRRAKAHFKHIPPELEDKCNQAITEFIEESLTSISWERYAVAGLTSVFGQHVSSLLFAKKLKEKHPEIKIVFGGANVQGDMGAATLNAFDWVDYVVDGEGEEVFPALVKNILENKPYEKLPGVSLRKNGQVFLHSGPPPMYPMNKAPIPDFTEYFRDIRASGLSDVIEPHLLFESSRGCWWGEKAHCTFCGLNGGLMKYRSKPARRVMREVTSQSRRYKTFMLEAVDNILDTESFSTFLPWIAERNLDVELFYEIKSGMDRRQMDLLDAAGITNVQPGIESLNTQVLKLMRKGVTAIQNVQTLRLCQEKKMRVSWAILYGFPGETRQHYEESLETAALISHLHPPLSVLRIILQRFSPYHFDAERFGIKNIRPGALYEFIYPKTKVDLDKLAFYFDYSVDGMTDNPESYIKPVRDFAARWQAAFANSKIRFTCRRGAGFLELNDNRPLKPDAKIGNPRKTILKGLTMDVFLFCDSIQSIRAVTRYVAERSKELQPEQVAERIVNDLVSRKLMMREKDRCLSLATPYSSLSH